MHEKKVLLKIFSRHVRRRALTFIIQWCVDVSINYGAGLPEKCCMDQEAVESPVGRDHVLFYYIRMKDLIS